MQKKVVLVGVLLAILLPVSIHAVDEGATMKGMVSDMYDYVEYLEDEMTQEIVHMHADLIFEDPQQFNRTLRSGWTYLITAFADWRVSDLDIIVYKDVDGQWIEIERDEETDNTPVVVVEPSSDGVYLVEIKVYSFATDDYDDSYTAAHYGLIISHEYVE
ncbi:hypothetical protein JXM67_08640 [candidate division WOR-3 bacterium]|nr:hypothetical protein [candidate division WOR-3 bacterium]